MLKALFVGSCVILSTLLLAGFLFDRAAGFFPKPALRREQSRSFLILVAALIWILGVLTISIWIWALVYLFFGVFDSLEPALYFSIVSFTTVGYGDLVLAEDWRLLAGMTATNGLLMFGLFTAFLVEVLDLARLPKK